MYVLPSRQKIANTKLVYVVLSYYFSRWRNMVIFSQSLFFSLARLYTLSYWSLCVGQEERTTKMFRDSLLLRTQTICGVTYATSRSTALILSCTLPSSRTALRPFSNVLILNTNLLYLHYPLRRLYFPLSLFP